MSIKENLQVVKPNLTEKEMIKACKDACLEEFIESLPDKYDTVVGEGGVTLSGGQRQALTLLMATIKKPSLLLLDEHTAALDPHTARIVLDISKEIVETQKITTLMITHNMKDAIACGNRLIMMDEGKIIYDVSGEEKKNLTIEDLLKKFENAKDSVSDSMILGSN